MTTKSDVLLVCYRMQRTLNASQQELEKKIQQLEETQLQRQHFIVDNRKKWFRKIVNYVTNGLTYLQAVQLLCEEELMDFSEIRKVLAAFNCERKTIQSYALIFAIKKLKKAGFSQKKTADILEVSTSTINQLQKQLD